VKEAKMSNGNRGFRDKSDGLVWGLVLISIGVVYLLSMNGVLPREAMWAWWPLFVIAAGVGSLVTARSPKKLGSAVTTLGIGAWLMVAANDWWNLGWNRSWPLALVAAGLGTLVEALAGMVWQKKEDGHVG
jgi:hypothetical protein